MTILCLTAFDELLARLPDLVLDTPDADVVLANFLARAVADDCLPPRYVLDLEALAKQEPPQHNGDLNGVMQNGDCEGEEADQVDPPTPLINEHSRSVEFIFTGKNIKQRIHNIRHT
jgi:hypothetical protein